MKIAQNRFFPELQSRITHAFTISFLVSRGREEKQRATSDAATSKGERGKMYEKMVWQPLPVR